MSEATPETTSTDNSDYVDPMINVCLDDRYTLEELIGRGGAAAVYRAHDEKVGRSVAIKLPKNAGAFAEESKADFEREASRYTRLQHPNTLRLFDYGQTRDGQTYIVTELLSGQTLKERLDSLEEVGKIGIAADVIDREKGIFLEQAKNEGKPENIAEKIVQGRVEKFFQENCLMEQAFVKNPDQTIEQLITDLTAKIGEKIGVRRFSCFRLGEE